MSDPAAPSEEDRIEQVLEAWFEARHAGETPDLAELCIDAPDLVPRVRHLLDRHAALLDTGDEDRSARQPLLVDRLGDYRLKSRIGHGGMGEVYLARQESLGRLVALKILRPEFAEEPTRRIRFRREAEITAALDHPNIVPVFETGEEDGHVFIAMKLLNGETLDRRPGPWESRRLATIGAQIARALHAAHEVGVVHRDVKPANILLAGDHPYMLDFGLARARIDLSLTREGHVPGTLTFMAPEQLQSGPASLDPRVDVYALGATLYTCLAGRAPFVEERPEVLVRDILVRDPDPIGGPAKDRDLETVILRALDKEPSHRFPTALEMALDLERFAGDYPIRSRRAGPVRRMRKLVQRHRLASAALSLGLTLIAVLGGLLWDRVRAQTAERDRQVAQVAADLNAGHNARALSRLRDIQRVLPEDPRYPDLEWRARTALQRDALLDQLQADRRYHDVAYLRALDEKLMSAGHPAVKAEPHTALAHLLLAYYTQEHARIARLLDDSRIMSCFPRCRAALAALLSGKDPVSALATAQCSDVPTMDVDDHVFSSVVLRIADRPVDAIEAELDSAPRLDPPPPRLRFGQALAMSQRGKRDVAIEMLVGLWDDDVPRPEVHVMLARLLTRRHEFVEARRQVDLARRAVDRNAQPAMLRLDLAELELLLFEGSYQLFETRLSEAKRRWGDSSLLYMLEGYAHSFRGDDDSARASFEAALASAQLPFNRRFAQSVLLSLDLRRLLAAADPDSVRDDAAALLERARRQLEEAREKNDVDIQAAILLALSKTAALINRTEDAQAFIREALRIDDENPDANLTFVLNGFELVWNSDSDKPVDDPARRDQAREALDRAWRLIRWCRSDPKTLSRPALARVFTCATALATVLNDRDRAVRTGLQAEELVEETGLLELVPALEECRRHLDLEAWPSR